MEKATIERYPVQISWNEYADNKWDTYATRCFGTGYVVRVTAAGLVHLGPYLYRKNSKNEFSGSCLVQIREQWTFDDLEKRSNASETLMHELGIKLEKKGFLVDTIERPYNSCANIRSFCGVRFLSDTPDWVKNRIWKGTYHAPSLDDLIYPNQ